MPKYAYAILLAGPSELEAAETLARSLLEGSYCVVRAQRGPEDEFLKAELSHGQWPKCTGERPWLAESEVDSRVQEVHEFQRKAGQDHAGEHKAAQVAFPCIRPELKPLTKPAQRWREQSPRIEA